jgi:hypothetical protein
MIMLVEYWKTTIKTNKAIICQTVKRLSEMPRSFSEVLEALGI